MARIIGFCIGLVWLSVNLGGVMGQSEFPSGDWQVNLDVGSETERVDLPFWLRLTQEANGTPVAQVINGPEQIRLGPVIWEKNRLQVQIPHYASTLSLELTDDHSAMKGDWRKRRGKEKTAIVPARAERREAPSWENPTVFLGRWSVRFADSEDKAIAVIQPSENDNGVNATFLTTTGDYRYLQGGVIGGELTLSCFDGAHAFLFKMRLVNDELKGVFYSGNWYQVSWDAVLDPSASLPDAFQQTQWTQQVPLASLSFPDLSGDLKSLSDPDYAGDCRIIELFGSWCPNCHDAGQYLSELDEKYGDRGLSILGLAFELTGEFEADAEQVRRFAKRNRTQYPLLIAGTADKQEATQQFKLLDQVRSFPTMIFLDRSGQVKAIYTGFSGPATGQAHEQLRRRFEAIIEKTLSQ